jgi:hypothetical protein
MQNLIKIMKNLGGATKPVPKCFGWQLIWAHTHEELKLVGGWHTPSPNALNTDHPTSNLCRDLKGLDLLVGEISKAFFGHWVVTLLSFKFGA